MRTRLDFEAVVGQAPTQLASVDLEVEAAIVLATLPVSCQPYDIVRDQKPTSDQKTMESSDSDSYRGNIGDQKLTNDQKAMESSDSDSDRGTEAFAPLNSDTLKALLSKRPKYFHAITVFQESVLYSEYEPFYHKEGHTVDYSILVDDFKRWKFYTNKLVNDSFLSSLYSSSCFIQLNPDPSVIYYHYKLFAAGWYGSTSWAVSMQMYRAIDHPEWGIILFGILRCDCLNYSTEVFDSFYLLQ